MKKLKNTPTQKINKKQQRQTIQYVIKEDQELHEIKNAQYMTTKEQLLKLNIKYQKNIQKNIIFKKYEYEESSFFFTSLIKSLSNNIDYVSLHLHSSFLNFVIMLIVLIACESRYDMTNNPNYALVSCLLIIIKFIEEFDYFHNKTRISFTDVYLGLMFQTFSRMWTIKLIIQSFQVHYLNQTLIIFVLGPMYFCFQTIILTLQNERYQKYFQNSTFYKVIKFFSIQNTFTVLIFLVIYYLLPQLEYKTFYYLKCFSLCLFFSVLQVFYLFSVILVQKIQKFQWQTSKSLFKRIFYVYAIIFLLIEIYVIKNHFLTHPMIRLLLQINLCLFIAVLIGKKQLERLTGMKQKTFSFQSCIFFINISLLIVWGLLNKKYDELQQLRILRQVLKIFSMANFLLTLLQVRKGLKNIVI